MKLTVLRPTDPNPSLINLLRHKLTCALRLQCIGSSRDAIAGTNLVDDSRAQIGWTCAGCIFNFSSDHSYTIATARGATYSGPTWNLNGKLSVGKPNALSVWVQLGAQVTSAAVKLTAKKSQASEVEYLPVDEAIAYAGCWTQLAGMYTLAGPADQVWYTMPSSAFSVTFVLISKAGCA